MKKTYIKPNQKVAEIELEALIADSPASLNDYEEGDGLVKEEENSLTSGKNLWDNLW